MCCAQPLAEASASSRAWPDTEHSAWSIPRPTEPFRAIKDYVAFYASRVDQCFVGEERVRAQDGDFYGGWITARIVGPFKGGPGTRGW
jgi:hypothetical protein